MVSMFQWVINEAVVEQDKTVGSRVSVFFFKNMEEKENNKQ